MTNDCSKYAELAREALQMLKELARKNDKLWKANQTLQARIGDLEELAVLREEMSDRLVG